MARTGDLTALQNRLKGLVPRTEVDQAIHAAAGARQAEVIALMLASGKASRHPKDEALWAAILCDDAASVALLLPQVSDRSGLFQRAVHLRPWAVLPLLIAQASTPSLLDGLAQAATLGDAVLIPLILPRASEVMVRQAIYEATRHGQWQVLPLLAPHADLDKAVKGLARRQRWAEVDQVLALGTPAQQAKWIAHYPADQLPLSMARVKAQVRLRDLQQKPAHTTTRLRRRG